MPQVHCAAVVRVHGENFVDDAVRFVDLAESVEGLASRKRASMTLTGPVSSAGAGGSSNRSSGVISIL
ncbi:MAG TPA: hypothetical protein VMH81_22105 [Bryobacteraceae bacterium]|nr:hypothetical protein [Bryobacteraceae bacterium]HXK05249.1 hypothetical protein [Verrucomicrobiae bacterium]